MNKDATWDSVREPVQALGKTSNAHSIWDAVGIEAVNSVEKSIEYLVYHSVERPVWDSVDAFLEDIIYE